MLIDVTWSSSIEAFYCLGLILTLTRYIWTDNESKSQQTSYRDINSIDLRMSKVPSYKTC